MTFLVQRVAGTSTLLHEYATSVLRIGRGTNCEVRSENPAVALIHAQIEERGEGYALVDQGSITGTYINGRPIEAAMLAKGDKIEIGDLVIDVVAAVAQRPLFLRLTSVLQAAEQPLEEFEEEEIPVAAGGVLRVRKIDYAAAFRMRRPYLTKLAISCLVLIVALTVIGEFLSPARQPMFMPGGVSPAHSRVIAENCGACHDPWHGVDETKCRACHASAPHSEREVQTPACTACHAEHRAQPKLTLLPDGKCTHCHADLTKRVKVKITGFGMLHPEFNPIADPDTLRLNHSLHLDPKGLLNREGKREVLSCAQCHQLIDVRGKVDPAPVRFDTACRRCQALTFDPRMPRVEVPHGGEPGIVYGFIGSLPRPAGETREAQENAAGVIKTRCQLCHEVVRRGGRLAVTAPVMPLVWLRGGSFSHTAHTSLECESCHDRARSSRKTSDVLVPDQSKCVRCHGVQTNASSTTCATCHVYHHGAKVFRARIGTSMPPTGDVTGMVQSVLLYAVVILMLMVAIPTALALFTRLRAPRERVIRQAPAPQAATPAPVPAAPKPAPAPAPRHTEQMDYFGLLVCVEGSLKGEAFIIEEQGFWIGRDPELADVVVDDSRISKRHVRIVARNGRVHAIDMESTHGTFIDKVGERIIDAQLEPGQILILAENVAAFRYDL